MSSDFVRIRRVHFIWLARAWWIWTRLKEGPKNKEENCKNHLLFLKCTFVVCFIASFICVWSFSQCSDIYYSGIKSKTCSSSRTNHLHSFPFYPLVFHSAALQSAHLISTFWISELLFCSYNLYCCFDPFHRFWSLLVSFGHSGFFKEPEETGQSSFDSFRTGAQQLLSLHRKTVDTLCREVNHTLHMCPGSSTGVYV